MRRIGSSGSGKSFSFSNQNNTTMKTNVADRPLSLAAHLRSLGDKLRRNTLTYAWDNRSKCNCGLLARTIIGCSSEQLDKMLNVQVKATWRDLANERCSLTGISTDKVFSALMKAGLQFDDITELEFMSNVDVIERVKAGEWTHTVTRKRFLRRPKKVMEPIPIKHDNAAALVTYVETWAKMIEEFHAARQPAPPTEAAMEATELRPLVIK